MPVAGDARYAVYWTPEPGHPLWTAGNAWLGRAADGAARSAAPPGRREPWRYGFHATLKAPLRLAAGSTRADFFAAVAAIAARSTPFALPPLRVATLGDFVALRPAEPAPALQALAERCVVDLDRWRRPPTADEAARRAAGLDADALALLQRWGYPHVLHRWRFHMTLSDALPDAAARESARAQATAWFDPALAAPCALSSLCVFEEAAPDAPLEMAARFAFGG